MILLIFAMISFQLLNAGNEEMALLVAGGGYIEFRGPRREMRQLDEAITLFGVRDGSLVPKHMLEMPKEEIDSDINRLLNQDPTPMVPEQRTNLRLRLSRLAQLQHRAWVRDNGPTKLVYGGTALMGSLLVAGTVLGWYCLADILESRIAPLPLPWERNLETDCEVGMAVVMPFILATGEIYKRWYGLDQTKVREKIAEIDALNVKEKIE